MKVVLVNTFESTGGAALAAQRLLKALNQQNEVEAQLLVHQKNSDQASVGAWAHTYWEKKWAWGRFVAERAYFYPYEKNAEVRFAFSPAAFGADIHQHPWIQEADIIHLHWITFGFLSLRSLDTLMRLEKPIVWTMHDMWPFTGGCHYSHHCDHYQVACGNCYFLKNPKEKDLSQRGLAQKQKVYAGHRIRFVGCSQWISNLAQHSAILKSKNDFQTQAIPNPIDIAVFKPRDKKEVAKELAMHSGKFIILFAALKLTDKRKGGIYFQQALKQLHEQYPDHFELLVFGRSDEEFLATLPYPTRNLGTLKGDEALVQAYSAAHVLLIPSLEDNLPNTIMEAMACGTPTVAFRAGGIPEMIDHEENGYLAAYKSSEDLVKGIIWLWQTYQSEGGQAYQQISQAARQKVENSYQEDTVAQRYIQVYQELLEAQNKD